MIEYTEQQIQEIKAIRGLYIAREIGADEYEYTMALIDMAAQRAAKDVA